MEDKNSEKNPLGDLFSSIKHYVDIRLDEIKLILAENSAKIVSKILYFCLMFLLIGIVLGVIAAALSSWFGVLLNNKTAGMFLTAGIFLVIALIVYLLRNKLFLNSNLRMFLKLFFNPKTIDDEEDEQE